MNKPVLALALLIVASSCSPAPERPPDSTQVDRSPEIRPDVIEQHARQFDEELPVRQAGSQQELAAASYLTGHLQLAGYTVSFDDVPVGNLVESSNVIALPPSGEEPEVMVLVAYDADPDSRQGSAIGLFLEAARALAVRVPNHGVSFVALGAQLTGPRPSMGLTELERSLRDQGIEPDLVLIDAVPTGPRLRYLGTDLHSETDNAPRRLMSVLLERGG